MAATTKEKVSISLTERAADVVERWAEEQHLTLSEVVRRALSLYDLIETEQKDGADVLLRKNGETERLRLLYS